MPYTSYNAYIVQTNGAVLLAMVILNYLIFSFNIWPLTYIFDAMFIQCLGKKFLLGKQPVRPNTPTPAPKGQQSNHMFADFLNFKKEKAINPTSATPSIPAPSTSVPNTSVPSPITSSASSLTSIFDTGSNSSFDISPQRVFSTLSNSVAPRNSTFNSAVPKLKFAPCIKPPLRPSAHRERIMWYMNRTEEVVADFRIEQILELKKNWTKFNDRYSSLFYDRLLLVLYEKIFSPLANAIEHFDVILAKKNQSLVKSPSVTIALSLVIPGFNNNADFTVSEVVDFLALQNHTDEESMIYVKNRILDLSKSNKLAGFRYTPKSAGMPSDADIMLHVLEVYLSLKEPMAIPPLVPPPVNFFKFLLTYVYVTPELDHWNIFENASPK
ncbi:hypothetical protein INT47_008072 [Mucor saturninus]|uniref:Uncharacterized protein n=1 Tax=Mucor saturninus TaxID=64648 RepID=A0A8H7V3D5_9FUNG|nr:hypothetical protein INT47_008072 [Mucor saturninus]